MPDVDAIARRGEIGSRLRRLRREGDLTQAELARSAAIGQASLSNYENGKRDMPLMTAVRLMDTLGFSLGDLLDGVEGIDVIRDDSLARATVTLSESPRRMESLLKRVHADASA